MIKKLFSFIFCLTPIGAMAATTDLYPSDNNGIINVTDNTLHLTDADNSVIIKNNPSYANPAKSLTVDNNGINISGGMIVGRNAGTETGWVFILNETTAGTDDGFTITSAGPINIGGMLQVENGNYLKIGQTGGATTSMTIGAADNIALDNSGRLELTNISAFTTTGTIRNNIDATSMDINAVSMSTGSIANMGGTMTIGHLDAAGNIIMTGGLNTNGGTIIASDNATSTNIAAASLESGKIQNNAGTMIIDLSGNLTSSGVIENKGGTSMKITAGGDITVADAMTNEAGEMVITAENLTINGQDATHNNASFVNSGNLTLSINGKLTLSNGFDTSAMDITNKFNLTVGELDVGGNDNWLQLFSNKLNSFNVAVRDGGLNLATDIINGQSANVSNADANMNITAQSISANSVTNSGKVLNIVANGETDGNIAITNGVTGNSGATTLAAAGTLDIGGAIANANTATMTLSGEGGVTIGTTTTPASVTNAGEMHISSLTSTTGKVTVNGTVTNNGGNLLIDSREIDITGTVTNNDGTMSIYGSDKNSGAVSLGALNATGGIVNLNSLIGLIDINGDMRVTDGALNIGGATTSITVDGETQINGDVTLSATPVLAAGAVNIGGAGVQNFVLKSANGIDIAGGISAEQSDFNRTAQFIAGNNIIQIGGDVAAAGRGSLIFGDSAASQTTITGDVTARKDTGSNTGSIEFYGSETTVGSLAGDGKFITHGALLTATNANGINIADTIWFNSPAVDPASGLIVKDTNTLTLQTTHENGDITAGAIDLASGNTLNMTSGRDITVTGTITDNGTLNMTAAGTAYVDNAVTVATTGALKIDAAAIQMADLTNNNSAELVATNITTGALNAAAGTMDITAADSLTANGALDIASGAVVNIAADDTVIRGPVTVNGNMIQGDNANVGALNITRSGNMAADSLMVKGDFVVDGNTNVYNFINNAQITGDIIANSGMAYIGSNSGKVSAKSIKNNATLSLAARNGIDINETIKSTGALTLDSGAGLTATNAIDWTGTTILAGAGLKTNSAFEQRMLYQNYAGALSNNDVNVKSNNYAITASYVDVTGIAQTSGQMILNTESLEVAQNIDASGLRVVGPSADKWLNVGVGGNVSGNTQFINLKHMSIGGNYTFNDNSSLVAAILPFATTTGTTQNYWATVNTDEGNNLGKITKPIDGEPLISVGGKFITDLHTDILSLGGETAKTGQLGIKIFDMIDQGTAIWLLHAEGGIEELATKIRNLNVQFCNADGSKCFDYYGNAEVFNGADEDLPAYVTVRDTDGTGTMNDMFIVFDPRFGGPLAMFKIQPIVGREPTHTKGEYVSAGALDDLIAGQLQNMKFNNRTPIDAIPVIFKGTNMEQMANQLYDRMEYYDQTRDGAALSRFSRLFQAREIEQLAGSIALNEHTSFRDFEDHMLDEFIWNRNRNLRKAWGEFDFGMFSQREADGHHANGNRFSFTGGYDWQENETLILGLAGRVSHMSGNNDDHMDLGYKPGESIAGSIDIDVADTNFGIGAYLLQNLGTKMRAYGNAFLDLHWLDVSRKQTYMSSIEGDGTSFSLISEWGLMHDWLNQYIVGNVYARVGYNFGFSVTEKAGGDDYMKLKSDGYFIFTPGYSLIAQKRIYPSAWFQIRPYASVGVEYDVLGAPDKAKYKFAPAHSFTNYDIEIDPLWANIGGGMEFLSATGVQVGLDYRYQYNADIQMHKIKLSGSYRF
ncbi:MAG: hypothetical protein K2I81_01705 [Alphaproteobacteria bacterium]|nr:hypothetical protein [Alphaproteobacteria bacterium]